jgi:hypothetical protein
LQAVDLQAQILGRFGRNTTSWVFLDLAMAMLPENNGFNW